MPPASIDLVLTVDVYHELTYPFVRALKPGGRVVFVEYPQRGSQGTIKDVHKMSVVQLEKERGVVGFEHLQTLETLPWQHIVIFEKRE